MSPVVEKSNGRKEDGKQLRNPPTTNPLSLFISQWLRAFQAGERREDIGEVRDKCAEKRRGEEGYSTLDSLLFKLNASRLTHLYFLKETGGKSVRSDSINISYDSLKKHHRKEYPIWETQLCDKKLVGRVGHLN